MQSDPSNLTALSAYYQRGRMVPVDRKKIIRFLRRCRGLSVSHARGAIERTFPPMVELVFDDGDLLLRQIGVPTIGNELSLATGLPAFYSFQPVAFLARELAPPLRIIDHIQLDYIYEQVLVLRWESQGHSFKWVTKGF